MPETEKHIRNFCIISHIDHGKSTLADRFLEITKTVEKNKMREQFLDSMELERERGITIKMQPVRMEWNGYQLNLIDTPGHIDFSYEVSRALAAVEGAILLVDATKGVQAQTLTNLHLAQEEGLVLIPAVNKVDLANARTQEVKEEIALLLEIDPKEVLEISGKVGTGVETLLQKIVDTVPPPKTRENASSLRALIFDSKFDAYKGVIAYVRVFEGEISRNNKIKLINRNVLSDAIEIGVFKPDLRPMDILRAGEIGYIATGIKMAEVVRVGETITRLQTATEKTDVTPLEGYREPKPMVFASFFTELGEDYDLLKDALNKLKLQDASLTFEDENSPALGRGFRCGFLGMLHLDIISERLKREFSLSLVVTSPTVLYRIQREHSDKEELIHSPQEFPENQRVTSFEPWAKVEILVPSQYFGNVQDLLKHIRGEFSETRYLGKDKLMVIHYAPLSEIISGFFDKLKSVTSGYASLNYELLPEFREAKLGKLCVLLAGERVEAFSLIVEKDQAYQEGKRITGKLKDVLPPQQFSVAIQATFDGKIIAREDKKAFRKDVIAGLYGGDYSRKRKLLEKQKKGKKKMKELGKVSIPTDVFLNVLRR